MKQIRFFLSILFLILMIVPAHAQKELKAADVGIDTKFYYRITNVGQSTPEDPRHLTVLGQDHKLALAQTIQDASQLWRIEEMAGDENGPIVRLTNRAVKDKSLDVDAENGFASVVLRKTLASTATSHPKELHRQWWKIQKIKEGDDSVTLECFGAEAGPLIATRDEDVEKRLVLVIPTTVIEDEGKGAMWVFSKTDTRVEEEFELTSTSFVNGAEIPAKYTQDELRGGANVSPPLAWKGAPAGTKSFLIICTDPDAPSPANPDPNPFVHWFILNIPADTKYLLAGVPRVEQVSTPFGAVQTANGFDEIGYAGPMPPAGSGKHRYIFTILAMDRVHVIDPNLNPEEFLKILFSSVLSTAELMGTYEISATSIQDSRLVLRSSEPLTNFEMVLRAAQSSYVNGL